MELNNYITEDILKRFKVFNPRTLFPPDAWELYRMINSFKCPLCFHNLYWRRDKKIAYCKSVKKDGFFITKQKLKDFGIQ